jgi:dTDP-4-amino-4,6-dideoxygalactose transaminase
VFECYSRGLGDLPGIEFMPERPDSLCSRWLTTITVDPARFGTDCEAIRLALEEENIESRPVWKPLHMQPLFAGSQMFGGAVSELLFRTGLCLPGGSNLAVDEQDRVIAAVRRVFRP